MSLTDLQVKRLKPPQKGQKTYYDPGLPGFGVRVSQGGSKTFVVLYGKKRHRRSLGRYPDISLAEARILAKQVQAEIALSELSPSINRSDILFQTAVELFLEETKSRTKAKTVGEYRRLLNRHFTFECKLINVKRDQILDAIEELKNTPSEQHHAFVAIRTLMNWCVGRGYIQSSLVPDLSFKTKPRDRVLNDRELALVWFRAEEFGWPFGRIVQLLILTGQRRGEIANLRRSWINEHTIHYPIEFVKNERPHTIPLGEWASAIINDLPTNTDLLFPSRFDDEKPFNGFSKSKNVFDRDLNIEPYTLHDLRRTFSSNMAKLGTPIHVTEKMLNHVSGTISGVAAVYNRHAYIDEMNAAYSIYEDYISGVLENFKP